MIHIKKEESYDYLPDKPFLESLVSLPVNVSLGKRINMRSECIDQLEKWHRLMECGSISNEELQETTLKDIKKTCRCRRRTVQYVYVSIHNL